MVSVPADGPLSAADAFVSRLGMRLVEWSEGSAAVELVVGAEHLNAIGRLHGGALFSLADSAVSRVSNRDPGDAWVVTSAQMTFLRATFPGDRLQARAVEDHRGARLGSYRVDVTSAGRLVATASAQAMRVNPATSGERGA